jgi:hypothetical protein
VAALARVMYCIHVIFGLCLTGFNLRGYGL